MNLKMVAQMLNPYGSAFMAALQQLVKFAHIKAVLPKILLLQLNHQESA
jgi:hypothetical protein